MLRILTPIPLCFQASGWISGVPARARFFPQIQRPLDFRTTRSASYLGATISAAVCAVEEAPHWRAFRIKPVDLMATGKAPARLSDALFLQT